MILVLLTMGKYGRTGGRGLGVTRGERARP
jgi:hypothetical protein